jgi:hypothetical protein
VKVQKRKESNDIFYDISVFIGLMIASCFAGAFLWFYFYNFKLGLQLCSVWSIAIGALFIVIGSLRFIYLRLKNKIPIKIFWVSSNIKWTGVLSFFVLIPMMGLTKTLLGNTLIENSQTPSLFISQAHICINSMLNYEGYLLPLFIGLFFIMGAFELLGEQSC